MDVVMKLESEYTEKLAQHMQNTCFDQCVKSPGYQKDLTGDEVSLQHPRLHTPPPHTHSTPQIKCVDHCAVKFITVYGMAAKRLGQLDGK